jgi:hypothetical protein
LKDHFLSKIDLEFSLGHTWKMKEAKNKNSSYQNMPGCAR